MRLNLKQLFGLLRTVKASWIISYLLVMLLPIIVSIIVFSSSSALLNSQLNAANQMTLTQIGTQIDRQLDEANNLMLLLSVNRYMTTILGKETDKTHQFQLLASNLATDLLHYRGINTNLPEVFAYFPQYDRVLTESALYDTELFVKKIIASSSKTPQDIKNYLGTRLTDDCLPVTLIATPNSGPHGIAITRSLPIDAAEPLGVNLTIFFNSDAIFQTIKKNLATTQADILIFDRNNHLLVKSGNRSKEEIGGLDLVAASQGLSQQDLGGGQYSIFYHGTKTFGWKVLLLVPQNVVSEKLITLQVIGLIGLLASLVIGIFLTMYLVQRNYSPLRKLLGSIAPQPDQEGDNDRNEFHLLARAIALARQESNQAHDWIEQNKSLLQEHFIRKLIHGTSVSGPSQSDMLAAHGLDFDHKPFVVVLVAVENLSTFEKTKRELRPGEPQKVLQFLISSTLQKYFEASATVVGIEDLGTFVYIVSFLHNTPEPDEIKEHLISLGRELEQSCQLTCSLSCSQLQQGHETLAIAFDEACRTMEYQLVVGNASYGTFADLPEDSPHPARYYYPMAEEIRLMNALKAADRMTAHSIIDQVLAKNPLVASPSGGIGRLLAYDLAATMVKALAEVHQEQDSSSISIDSLHRMSEVRGPESLKPELFSLVDQVCNQAQVRGDTARDQYRTHANRLLTAKIRHHIQGHIDNVGLNISSIADELGFGPTHISRVFRENQDQGLLDFINTVRVNRSKEFLKNRDLTLQEVARANGFQDANAYIRIFKKILGMTPGKYREISQ